MTDEELQSKVDELCVGTTKHLYVLEGRKVVPCKRMSDWGGLINNPGARTVAVTYTKNYRVSTMFVGMEGFERDDKGNPLVFETMVFCDGEHDQDCYKYGTWEDAFKGHMFILNELMEEPENESN